MGICFTTEATYEKESMLLNTIRDNYFVVEDKFLYSRYKNRIVGLPKSKDHYGGVGVRYNKKTYYINTHRLIWILLKGLIPVGFVINHKDGIKSNNHIDNLEICTVQENSLHAYRLRLNKFEGESGIENRNARFRDNNTISFIRESYRNKSLTVQNMSEIYNVSTITIRNIIKYKHYKEAP